MMNILGLQKYQLLKKTENEMVEKLKSLEAQIKEMKNENSCFQQKYYTSENVKDKKYQSIQEQITEIKFAQTSNNEQFGFAMKQDNLLNQLKQWLEALNLTKSIVMNQNTGYITKDIFDQMISDQFNLQKKFLFDEFEKQNMKFSARFDLFMEKVNVEHNLFMQKTHLRYPNNDTQLKIDEMGQKLEQLLSENKKAYLEQENKIEIIVRNMESKLKQLISDKLTEQGSKNKTKIDEMALKFNQLLSENQKVQENKTQLKINDLESKFKALLSDNLKIGLKELEKKVQQQIDDIKLQFDQFLEGNQQTQNVIQKLNDQLKSKGSLQQQTTNNSKTNQTDLNDLEITLVQFISKQEDLNNKQQSFVQNLLDRISQIETKELQEIEDAFGFILKKLDNIENKINNQTQTQYLSKKIF